MTPEERALVPLLRRLREDMGVTMGEAAREHGWSVATWCAEELRTSTGPIGRGLLESLAKAAERKAAKTRARAQRDRHDEAQARATLARMTQPLQSLSAVAYAANRNPSTMRTWNDLTQAERDVIAGRVRYGLDYLAGGDGNGTIYSAGPTDPIPVQPPT